MQEIGDQPGAVGRVNHFGVEHRRVVAARLVGGDRIGRVLRDGVDAKALGQPGHAVAVAHPHRIAPARPPDAFEQGAWRKDLDVRPAELGRMPALDLAAELLAQRLLAVADGEDRHAAVEDRLRRARTALRRDRSRTAGENYRLRREAEKRLRGVRKRMNFAVNAGLAHPSRDQLRDLGAEIDDEDAVMLHRPHVAPEQADAQ